MDAPGISTKRLLLREWQESELPLLHTILGDARVMAAYEGPFSEEESLHWLRAQRKRYAEDGFGLWAVFAHDGEFIGQCGITRQTVEGDEILEVGYHLPHDRWGRGFAVEAAAACRDWAFRELDAPAVWAKIRSTNIASMNVAIRLVMTVRRAFTTHYRGVDMPHLAFAIDRSAALRAH